MISWKVTIKCSYCGAATEGVIVVENRYDSLQDAWVQVPQPVPLPAGWSLDGSGLELCSGCTSTE